MAMFDSQMDPDGCPRFQGTLWETAKTGSNSSRCCVARVSTLEMQWKHDLSPAFTCPSSKVCLIGEKGACRKNIYLM